MQGTITITTTIKTTITTTVTTATITIRTTTTTTTKNNKDIRTMDLPDKMPKRTYKRGKS
jgi:hypothetical protein